MARKSQLSERQWGEIERKLANGGKVRRLADEYGVSPSAISKRFSSQTKQVKALAHQYVAIEQQIRELPVSAQISAQSLIDELRAVSFHLAGAAKFGAMTAHRLNGLANFKANELDDIDPDMETLMTVAKLSAVAKDQATIGLNLLAANRDTIKEVNSKEMETTDDPLKTIREIRLTGPGFTNPYVDTGSESTAETR